MVIVAASIACGRSSNPTASPGDSFMSPTAPSFNIGMLTPSDVTFPPRNEPFDFRNQLEAKYRDQLRAGSNQTFVNNEGDIVWTQEYLRYRVNACDHEQAVQRVFSQIDSGGGAPAVCGASQSGTIQFPPRNEPFDFRQRLEVKYRDQLRASPTTTFVNIEGAIVWTQEYLRYRVNACDHNTAVQKVFMQIDGAGVQPVCGTAPPPPPPPPGALSASFAVQLAQGKCDAASAGNVTCTFVASASGGTTPYTFTWTFTNPANGQVVTANTQQTSPALGCNYSAGVSMFNLSINLVVRSADGQSRTVTGTQLINRLAGNCGV